MLPRVKIYFENGALGQVRESPDGVMGLLCTGVAVAATFVLATPYTLRSYADLKTLGITAANNPDIEKTVREFYNEAGQGAELWLMAFPDTVTLSQMVSNTDETKGMALLNAANGRIRGLLVSRTPSTGYTPTTTNGLDADVADARANAQLLAEWATTAKFAPIFVIVEGYGYTGNPIDLDDLTLGNDNRVGIFVGDTVQDSPKAAMGIIGGRLALSRVHENIGKVKMGALTPVAMFIKDKPVEQADVESIHNKGYITLRTFVGRSGYFFSDDPTATLPTDDYSHLTARRTIDKAYRIAYDTMLDELLSEVPLNEDGTLQAALCKNWEQKVELAIAAQMTASGELSADISNPKDLGVKCSINPAQNVLGTSRVDIQVRVRPFAYPRYIDIYLGFQAVTQ